MKEGSEGREGGNGGRVGMEGGICEERQRVGSTDPLKASPWLTCRLPLEEIVKQGEQGAGLQGETEAVIYGCFMRALHGVWIWEEL